MNINHIERGKQCICQIIIGRGRDVAKGLPIHVPVNYYLDDDPEQPPLFRWRAHAHLLYENWLNYYVYQNTPYDLGEIQRVKHGK